LKSFSGSHIHRKAIPLKRVRSSVFVTLLAAIALLFGGITPNVAQAAEATGWPLHMVTGMTPTSMTAFGNDTLSLANCTNRAQNSSFQYIHEGVSASTLPFNAEQGPVWDDIDCGVNRTLATADGTYYTTDTAMSYGYPTYRFEAIKNGRVLWKTDVSSPSVCSAMSTWGVDKNDATMTNASQGSDGNIYGIIQAYQPGCATYLAKVDSATGVVLFKQQLTASGSGKTLRLWVYDDKLLTIDNTGLLRQFDYDGTEDTSAAYQFPSSMGTFWSAYANAAGRVFATSLCFGSGDTNIAYHDPNGDSNVAASGLGCNPNVFYTPGGDGSLVAHDCYNTATTFHFTTTGMTATSVTLPTPSGVGRVYPIGYWQDQNGNAVTVRQFYSSGGPPDGVSAGVSVDETDGTTGAVTNLLLVGVDSTHPSPSLKTADISPDGYLYAVICHNNSACGNTSGSSLDGWVHKVQTTGFGSPIKDTGQFATYTTTDHTLVAIGDSYSSGEGNAPYLAGTDQTDDFCHRSAAAYPELLEKDTSLHLNMTAFVACSGAQTHDILNVNSNNLELPQAVFAESQPDIITMSIGGNNVKFADAMSTCTIQNQKTSEQTTEGMSQPQADEQDCTQALSTSATLIDSSLGTTLTNLYNSLNGPEGVAPIAKLLVVGYPQLFPEYSNITGTCEWGESGSDAVGLTSGRLVSSTDVNTIRSLTAEMNDLIHTAVDNTGNSNVMFVDPTSAFAGHELCTSSPWLYGVVPNVDLTYTHGSYHPNTAGQAAYESAVAAKISTLTFP
jgi:hypothetical protein